MKKPIKILLVALSLSIILAGCFPLPKKRPEEPTQEPTQQSTQVSDENTNSGSAGGYVQGSEGLAGQDGYQEEEYEDFTQESGGVWPWTEYQKVSKQDLSGLSDWDLDIMRNEIYARHGYIFNRKDLQNYFESQAWYYPAGLYENKDQVNKGVEQQLSEIEKYNAEKILQYQKGQW